MAQNYNLPFIFYWFPLLHVFHLASRLFYFKYSSFEYIEDDHRFSIELFLLFYYSESFIYYYVNQVNCFVLLLHIALIILISLFI